MYLCMNMIFIYTARYMAKGFLFVCGVRLIHLATSIQGRGGLVSKLLVVLHYLAVSVIYLSDVRIFVSQLSL